MYLNGEIVKMSFERKNLQEMGKWTEDIVIPKKIWTPGIGLPQPRGNIHVYYNYIKRSSLKPNFIGSIYGKGE